jgi:hypothetical protein
MAASMVAMQTGTRISVQEARITNNDVQAHEVRHAAEAALDYGITWYSMSEPVWTVSGGLELGSPTTAMPAIAASNGDTYTPTVVYSRNPAASSYVMITATATAASNASVTATVRQYVAGNALLRMPGLNGPPLMVGGCLSDVAGNPDIWPAAGGEVAVATSEPPDCLDEGAHLGYNGGVEAFNAFTGDLWDQIFTKSRAQIKAIADAEVAAGVADADRTVVWVTSTANYHLSWGSPSHAVILVFDAVANCPVINGTPTYYGVVFIDSDCPSANGFGGTDVYGVAAVNGDIEKYNSNTDLYHWNNTGATTPGNLKGAVVPRLMGTWNDI